MTRSKKSARKPAPAKHTATFEALGTQWCIDVFASVNDHAWLEILKQVRRKLELFDKIYSRFRSDSLVWKMSKQPGCYRLPAHAQVLLALYEHIYRLTNGAFTPLVGDFLIDTGYDHQYSLTTKATVRTIRSWDETIAYSYPYLTIKKPTMLDFGAAGKGYAIDLVAQLLENNAVTHFIIDAGGDIVHKDPAQASITIGLEHPNNSTKVLGTTTLSNKAIAASAVNRRAWGNYHHIVNSLASKSTAGILATWVIAGSGLFADALATALFVATPEVLQTAFEFDYFLITHQGSLAHSANFPVELFK